jgi:hypothetical protein
MPSFPSAAQRSRYKPLTVATGPRRVPVRTYARVQPDQHVLERSLPQRPRVNSGPEILTVRANAAPPACCLCPYRPPARAPGAPRPRRATSPPAFCSASAATACAPGGRISSRSRNSLSPSTMSRKWYGAHSRIRSLIRGSRRAIHVRRSGVRRLEPRGKLRIEPRVAVPKPLPRLLVATGQLLQLTAVKKNLNPQLNTSFVALHFRDHPQQRLVARHQVRIQRLMVHVARQRPLAPRHSVTVTPAQKCA